MRVQKTFKDLCVYNLRLVGAGKCTHMPTLVPVVSQSYTHEASNEYVIIGNDALFKCEIPSFVADSLEIAGWVDSDGNEYTRQFTPQTNRLQQGREKDK